MMPHLFRIAGRANRFIFAGALVLVRFLTQMGSSRAEAFVWRCGAVVSGAGCAIVLAAELGSVAILLSTGAWTSGEGVPRLAIHLTIIFFLGHFIVALVRGVREPHHSCTGAPKP